MQRFRLGIFTGFILILVVGGCGLADIRTELLLKEGETKELREKGRAIFNEMLAAHGGLERWRELKTMSFTATDQWSWLSSVLGAGWPENPQKLQFSFPLDSESVRVEFLEGEGVGQSYGVQHWAPYRSKDGAVEFEDSALGFYLKFFRSFMELPFYLADADVIYFAGEAEAAGKKYDRVFVAWRSFEPLQEFDQYVLWINQKTHLLDYAHVTVREWRDGATDWLWYTDYREVQGIKVPFMYSISATEPGPTVGHYSTQLKLESATFDRDFPTGYFFPDPTRKGEKGFRGFYP